MPGSPLRQSTLPFDQVERGPATTASPASAPLPEPLPAAWTAEYVRHPRARRYLLRVRVDGRVRVTIPRGGSRREAARFVEAHTGWIEQQLVAAARTRAARRPPLPAEERHVLMARAKQELPPRLRELAERHGLAVARISIRNQKWRWGSCSRQAHICLNWRLVTMPDWVRDYVLIHELMHLRRMDHSPAFWKHVAAACPEYERARAWLRAHGGIAED